MCIANAPQNLARGASDLVRISLISLHFSEYAARLAIALSSRCDVQLHLAKHNAENELTEDLRAELCNRVDVVFHERVTRKNSPLIGAGIARSIWRFRPDVIHAQEAGDWAVAFARILCPRIRFIYTVHDATPHSGSDEAVARRNRWPRKILRHTADAIIVHGASIASAMSAGASGLAQKVHVVSHGLLGESLDAPDRVGKSFLFFGRIEAYKGLDILLSAVEELASRGTPVDLQIAGRGADLDHLRPRIDKLPTVTLNESFVPAEQVPELMRNARAIILPYRNATQSGVVANAFAAGVSVVATRVGALTDVLVDETNALVVPPNDTAALADAMARLVKDDGLARRLAQGAVVTARTQLAWGNIARATETIYSARTA